VYFGVLDHGQEVHGPVGILVAVVEISHVGNDADDFEVACVNHFVGAEALADGVLALEELLDEGLIDDRNERCVFLYRARRSRGPW
jgi:hypothetical protein